MRRASKAGFYNASTLALTKIVGDQDNIDRNLQTYIDAFSPEVRDIFERFNFVLFWRG